jgi:hypothetical protein
MVIQYIYGIIPYTEMSYTVLANPTYTVCTYGVSGRKSSHIQTHTAYIYSSGQPCVWLVLTLPHYSELLSLHAFVWPELHIHTAYDRMVNDFPAKNARGSQLGKCPNMCFFCTQKPAIHCPSIRLGPFLLQIEAGIMSYTRMCLDSCGSLCVQIGRASSSQWLPKP